jgi:hypothetical protein
LEEMELVIDTRDNALVDDLDILGEELVQSHFDLKGDVVKPHHHDAHQKVYFFMFHVVLHHSFP